MVANETKLIYEIFTYFQYKKPFTPGQFLPKLVVNTWIKTCSISHYTSNCHLKWSSQRQHNNNCALDFYESTSMKNNLSHICITRHEKYNLIITARTFSV